MALTTAQVNAHLRQIVLLEFDRTDEALEPFLRACVAYGRAGGADEKETASTIARAAWQAVKGRTLTAQDVHELLNHRAEPGVLS